MHAFVLSMWIAGCPVVDMLQNFGACVVPIGALTGLPRFAQVAKEVFPKMLNCTPSFAEYLIKKLPEQTGVDTKDLGIENLVLSGEPGAMIPHIRERIQDGFGGAQIYDSIGATGSVFVCGSSCEAYSGIHYMAEDYCYFELVDPKTLEPLPLENGVVGEVVYTGLEKECAPVIRWRDKDMVQVFTEPCECGKPGFRFMIQGRADDMLLVRGVNVYPHAVKDVVLSFLPKVTGTIRIVLDSPPPVVQPPLKLRVEFSAGLSEEATSLLAHEIEEKIHHILRFKAKVEMVPSGTFDGQMGLTLKSQILDKQYE